jgi:hypothetical protein
MGVADIGMPQATLCKELAYSATGIRHVGGNQVWMRFKLVVTCGRDREWGRLVRWWFQCLVKGALNVRREVVEGLAGLWGKEWTREAFVFFSS